jgi:hypothetical protein
MEVAATMRTFRLLLSTVVLAAGVLASWQAPGSVYASCAMAPSLEDSIQMSPVVFVGLVTRVEYHRLHARVRVTDIWKGKNIPSHLTVSGAMASESRFFRAGVRYLFVPARTRYGWLFADSICTATRPFTKQVAAYRPPDAHKPK